MGKHHYIVSDLKRLLKSYEFYFSFLGVAAVLFFSLEDVGISDAGVVFTYVFATDMTGMMLAYVFCAWPFATVLCEDMEKKYVRYAVVRGSLKDYVISKVVIIYSSSVFSMIIGTVFFLCICRAKVPWVDLNIDNLSTLMAGNYKEMLSGGHYFLYCILFALQLGFFAGTLSVVSAFLSTYISNKVTVLVFPVLIFQILAECSRAGINYIYYFRAYNRISTSNCGNFIGIFLLSILPVIFLTFGMYKKLKTRL